MRKELADEIIQTGLIKCICDEYHLIILGDHIPNGRPFLQASPDICKSKILVTV
jgi:hypothetical protein